MSLKKTLRELDFDNRLSIEKLDLDQLIESMLANIGSTDPELRDSLIYNTFCRLVMEDYLSEDQMKSLLKVCLDGDHLFYKIGEWNSDSVFTRSFSSLVIAVVLEKEKQKDFLDSDTLAAVTKACLDYLKEEADIRGYVEEKGWAHSIAHGADMLEGLVRVRESDMEFAFQCLETIKMCLYKGQGGDGPYIDDEEERLIFVVEALLDKGLTDGMESWVTGLSIRLEELLDEEGYSINFFRIKTNVLNFLKALYFRFSFQDEHAKVRETLRGILKYWHEKIYGHGQSD